MKLSQQSQRNSPHLISAPEQAKKRQEFLLKKFPIFSKMVLKFVQNLRICGKAFFVVQDQKGSVFVSEITAKNSYLIKRMLLVEQTVTAAQYIEGLLNEQSQDDGALLLGLEDGTCLVFSHHELFACQSEQNDELEISAQLHTKIKNIDSLSAEEKEWQSQRNARNRIQISSQASKISFMLSVDIDSTLLKDQTNFFIKQQIITEADFTNLTSAKRICILVHQNNFVTFLKKVSPYTPSTQAQWFVKTIGLNPETSKIKLIQQYHSTNLNKTGENTFKHQIQFVLLLENSLVPQILTREEFIFYFPFGLAEIERENAQYYHEVFEQYYEEIECIHYSPAHSILVMSSTQGKIYFCRVQNKDESAYVKACQMKRKELSKRNFHDSDSHYLWQAGSQESIELANEISSKFIESTDHQLLSYEMFTLFVLDEEERILNISLMDTELYLCVATARRVMIFDLLKRALLHPRIKQKQNMLITGVKWTYSDHLILWTLGTHSKVYIYDRQLPIRHRQEKNIEQQEGQHAKQNLEKHKPELQQKKVHLKMSTAQNVNQHIERSQKETQFLNILDALE